MVILVSGATATLRRYAGHPYFGQLITPRTGNKMQSIVDSRLAWGADNDAYQGWTTFREASFVRMIAKLAMLADKSRLKFVTAPDVVGDRAATNEKWRTWYPRLRQCGLPAAYVLQDGTGWIPWDQLDVLFVGGLDEFKMSSEVDEHVATAKRFGKWVHVGRVNTKCRLRHFHEIGVDSVDGTFFSRWPDIAFSKALRWLRNLDQQPVLPLLCEGEL